VIGMREREGCWREREREVGKERGPERYKEI
jgi:hypothetical protein